MNILQIPDQLANSIEGKILLVDYHTTSSHIKSKMVLTKNVFSFLQEGIKGIITEDRTVSIDNQEFLLVRSGNCLMTEKISKESIYRSILLFFDDSVLSDFYNDAGISRAKTNDNKVYSNFLYDDYIKQFVDSLIRIGQQNLQPQQGLLKAKFEEIMYYLLDKHGEDLIFSLFPSVHNAQKDFDHIMESNKLNNLTLQELAFLCNMSISTFKRNFKERYQISPIRWFQQRRLEHAAYLLQVEKRRPSDIYLEIGFENLSSFIQAFKQRYDQTPKQFQIGE